MNESVSTAKMIVYQGDGEIDTFFSLLKMRGQPLKVWIVV